MGGEGFALPERYDIACAAYAFTLMLTLAVSGETSVSILAARAWETLIGGALGVVTATIIFPIATEVVPQTPEPQKKENG